MDDERWIVVPNWGRFQHYSDRNPTWIKLYTELAHKPEWNDLTLAARGLLVTIWISYAASRGQLRVEDVRKTVPKNAKNGSLRGVLRQFNVHLESLNHAGFIELSASKPLAQRYQRASTTRAREKEVSKETSKEGASARASAERSASAPEEEKTAEARKRVERDMRRTEAINEAERLAADWDGKDSERFDEALAELEQRHRVELPFQVRERLWDSVFGPTPAV